MIEYTKADTIAHEQMAKDEQHIGEFFASFAIQYLLHKDMLQNKLTAPKFLKHFGDISISASQRILIKEIISSKELVKVTDELQNILLESLAPNSKSQRPDLIFLSRIQKAFLIRQIFKHSSTVLPKYEFIEQFINKDIRKLDLKSLYKQMWALSVEQQIIILCRIFASLEQDGMDSKRKTIIDSFSENLTRWKKAMQAPEYEGILNSPNIVTLSSFIKNFHDPEL